MIAESRKMLTSSSVSVHIVPVCQYDDVMEHEVLGSNGGNRRIGELVGACDEDPHTSTGSGLLA
jgi:hypothetical protein